MLAEVYGFVTYGDSAGLILPAKFQIFVGRTHFNMDVCKTSILTEGKVWHGAFWLAFFVVKLSYVHTAPSNCTLLWAINNDYMKQRV